MPGLQELLWQLEVAQRADHALRLVREALLAHTPPLTQIGQVTSIVAQHNRMLLETIARMPRQPAWPPPTSTASEEAAPESPLPPPPIPKQPAGPPPPPPASDEHAPESTQPTATDRDEFAPFSPFADYDEEFPPNNPLVPKQPAGPPPLPTASEKPAPESTQPTATDREEFSPVVYDDYDYYGYYESRPRSPPPQKKARPTVRPVVASAPPSSRGSDYVYLVQAFGGSLGSGYVYPKSPPPTKDE
jgi:hypothetical protein